MTMKPDHPCGGVRTRRSFLRVSSAATAALALSSGRVLGANSDIRVGVIGLGGKGGQHVKLFSSLPGVRVTALCEVDPERLAKHVDKLRDEGTRPFAANDPRRVLERDDVDAVVIATPNHWHALLTVWALRAGKHVYVEKPVSHSVWEGARMVAEARERGRLVQSGLQYRSCPGLREAAAWLQEGHLGKLLWGQVVWYEHRPPIGKCAPFIPQDLDYDLWCGPAPVEPLTRPRLHYDWHWFWSTGDGDVGNSSVHAFDALRIFAPELAFPTRIRSLGGRFTYDDAAQTPNTQFTLAEYPGLPLVIENRNLSMVPDAVVMDRLRRVQEGFVLEYEDGYFAGFRMGGAVYDHAGKAIKRFQGNNGATHQRNFVEALRSGRVGDLHAPIEQGHISSAVCHLGNISYRLAQPAGLAACRAELGGQPPAGVAFERLTQSLEGIGVDPDRTPFLLGPWLRTEETTGEITGLDSGDPTTLTAAQRLARGSHRAPFTFPV
ncbi:MAG: Gfo/Idh/MocA family oxidoreductase [Verrucomicrobiales bacterium]|nr:Gfo/Idh/MocA family oxidoreductase [Verrucomicrobiales bacterium]